MERSGIEGRAANRRRNAKEATETEAGYTGDRDCKVCGYTENGKEIPAAGESGDLTKPADPPLIVDLQSALTGDNSNFVLWFVVLFIFYGRIIGIVAWRKRKKKRAE